MNSAPESAAALHALMESISDLPCFAAKANATAPATVTVVRVPRLEMRGRKQVSCETCRRKRLKCSGRRGDLPCVYCVENGAAACVFHVRVSVPSARLWRRQNYCKTCRQKQRTCSGRVPEGFSCIPCVQNGEPACVFSAQGPGEKGPPSCRTRDT